MNRFELAAVGVLGFLVFLRAVVILGLAFAIIRPVRDCPACFRRTAPVRVRWHRLLPSRFEWRWCPRCGWEGPGRRVTGTERVPVSRSRPTLPESTRAHGKEK